MSLGSYAHKAGAIDKNSVTCASVIGRFTGEDLNHDGFINLHDDEVFTFAAVFTSTGPVPYFEFDTGVFTILEDITYEVGSLELGDNSKLSSRHCNVSSELPMPLSVI